MAVAMALYLGANGYIFSRLWQALGRLLTSQCAEAILSHLGSWQGVVTHSLRPLFAILFWGSSIALFIAIGVRNIDLPDLLHRTLFTVGSIWLVWLLYMVLTTLLFDLAHLIFPALQGGVWYALAITTLILVLGYGNYRNPHIEHLDIALSKPSKGESLRMVVASDIHLGYGTTRRDLSRYVDMINRQKGDVVVIVGDLIDNSIAPVNRAAMEEELLRIDAPQGVYMVAGNHEYISGIEACSDFASRAGITLLRDSVVRLDCGIQLLGRDDRTNRRRMPLDSLVSRADASLPMVVLDHQPNDIARSNRLGVDIHLSGHTHRGQVWPISLITDAIFDQSHGYRKWSHTHAYVSTGLSLWGPPFRIGTNSELVVLDIRM